MAHKEKLAKKGPILNLEVPDEGVILPASSGVLSGVRQRLGLSQPALADACRVSRDVIANYENGRTKLGINDALKVWRVLEVKERALGISSEKKGTSAAQYLLGVLWYAKETAKKRLAEIDGQIENLQRKRESVKREIAELEAEEADRRKATQKQERK